MRTSVDRRAVMMAISQQCMIPGVRQVEVPITLRAVA
jgi:hypothetical protein